MKFHRRRANILGNTPMLDTSPELPAKENIRMDTTIVTSAGGAVASDTAIYLTSKDLVIKSADDKNLYMGFQGRNLSDIITKAFDFCLKRDPPWTPIKIKVLDYK